jgi:ABC-type phosphate transport system permease subunit
MAATLALVAAFLLALPATLQQKGALNLATISLADPMSLVRLVGEKTWLIGTLALSFLVAVIGLCLALVGAVVISLAREARKEEVLAADVPDQPVATA